MNLKLTRELLSLSLIIGSFFLKSHTTHRVGKTEARMCCTEIMLYRVKLLTSSSLDAFYHIKLCFQ